MRIRPTEESTCTRELIAWLGQCYRLMLAGRPIPFDPFYDRNSLLTPEVVENVIRTHEENMLYELTYHPEYHAKGQGIVPEGTPSAEAVRIGRERLRPTGFDKLPYQQRLAVVQGVDRVCNAHRMTPEDEEAEAIQKKKEDEARQAYYAERARNLAANPRFYDYEYLDGWYGD